MTAKTRAQIQSEVSGDITSNNAGQITGQLMRTVMIDLSDSMPVFGGAWSSTTSYVVNDIVTYQGVSYIATVANLNSAPPSANWSALFSFVDLIASLPTTNPHVAGQPWLNGEVISVSQG